MLMFAIIGMFLVGCLPSKTTEYRVTNWEVTDKEGLNLKEDTPVSDFYIRVNDSKVVLRGAVSTIKEHPIDSITMYKDIDRIMWSKGTIIIVMPDENLILVETNCCITQYYVEKQY